MNEFPQIKLLKLYRETNSRVDALSRAVREGKYLEEALDFSRWLLWSGLLDLLTHLKTDFGIPNDVKGLRRKIEALQSDVQERFVSKDMTPQVPSAELDKINARLARMEEFLVGSHSVEESPKLQIVNGGKAA